MSVAMLSSALASCSVAYGPSNRSPGDQNHAVVQQCGCWVNPACGHAAGWSEPGKAETIGNDERPARRTRLQGVSTVRAACSAGTSINAHREGSGTCCVGRDREIRPGAGDSVPPEGLF